MRLGVCFIFATFCLAYNEPFAYNPFIIKGSFGKKNISIAKKITVDAIMNNRAFINGKWYKKGQRFGIFYISKIDKNSVRMVGKSKTLVIPIGKETKRYLKLKDRK